MVRRFLQRMISEHAELVERIVKLHNYVYSAASDKDDKIEFANKCIQLSAMKKYEEALRARLENHEIICEDGEYFHRVDKSCYENNNDGITLTKCPLHENEDKIIPNGVSAD